MKIKVITGLEYVEPVIEIKCHEVTKEIENVVNTINKLMINITGKKDGETFILKLDDIYYFEAVENHVYAYLESDVYEVEYKVADLNDLLMSTTFIQTSRTTILNISKINKIKSIVNGRILAVLINGEKQIISRAYAREFKNKLMMKGEHNHG